MTASTDASGAPVILTEVRNRIGIITLNRPERRNALNGALIEALDVAVQEMADNPEAKIVVLTGARRATTGPWARRRAPPRTI